jgi:hypothetical protein
MERWFWQLKWALVIAIVAGPVFAYFSYTTATRIERVMASGVEYTAAVTGGVVERGRRGTVRAYKLQLGWVDGDGAPHADSLKISSTYAHQIFVDDYVTLETAQVRYLPSEIDGPVVVAADGPQRIADERMNMWLGIGAGILGLILAPIWFWMDHRRKLRDDDIDATLAQMRAGQQSP